MLVRYALSDYIQEALNIAFFIMVRYVFEDEKIGEKGHHNNSNE